MITFKDGFSVNATVETAVINVNDEWKKIIIIRSESELKSLFLYPVEFKYGNVTYSTNGFVKTVDGGIWVLFNNVSVTVDEVTPLKEEVYTLRDYVIEMEYRIIMKELGE